MRPDTRYARSGDVNIAYQVVGEGPRDIVLVPGWVSNIEVIWDEPHMVAYLQRLASFARIIVFDKRGTGLSDRVSDMPNLETRMDDVRAVMDATKSSRAALLGSSEGGAMCALFAATYPERTTALIMCASFARRVWAPDHPWGPTRDEWGRFIEASVREWGTAVGLEARAPSLAGDARFREWWARYLRLGASPAAAQALFRMNGDIDIRHVLPAIRVPTLILHRRGDRAVPVETSRYMAERIPRARYVELDGNDHLSFLSSDDMLDEIEEFLTGVRRGPEPDRILATVMFTDIVDATRRATDLGDRRWRDLLDAHHALVREQLARFRGREIDTAGDGFLAAFDGPPRAVRAACAVSGAIEKLGIAVRAGLHTGECEVDGSQAQWCRRSHRRARGEPRRRRRGIRIEHREGPGGGIRTSLRRPGRARAQGRPGRVEAVRGGPRRGGVVVTATAATLRGDVESFRWAMLSDRIAKSLGRLTREDLDAAREHSRRGTITGRDVLIVVAHHTAEHWGEAQLTRSLMKARAGGRQS